MASLFSIRTLCVVGILVIQMDPVFPCDTLAVLGCVGNNFGDDGLPDVKGVPPIEKLQSFCRAFQRFKLCVETPMAECSGSSDVLQIHRLYSTLKYLCEDKYAAILSSASCWNNDQVQDGMNHCATFNVTSAEGPTPDCSGLQKVNQCMENTVRVHCGEEEASLIKDLLQHTFAAIFPQTCDFNSVRAFRSELTSLLLALVVAVLVVYRDGTGNNCFRFTNKNWAGEKTYTMYMYDVKYAQIELEEQDFI